MVRDKSQIPSYTKQQIFSGIFDTKKHAKRCVKSLVWLSKWAVEMALKQGTIFATMPDGKTKAFGFHCDNKIPYSHCIKDFALQKRYIYFCPLSDNFFQKHENRAQVVIAGDLCNIGFGKLIGVAYTNPVTRDQEMRLGILADTGGAFTGKLDRIDFFAGIFDSYDDLQKKHLCAFQDYAEAFIVYRKNSKSSQGVSKTVTVNQSSQNSYHA